MKLVIDGRESGTSTGRYIDKLIEHLHALKPDFELTILTKTARVDFIQRIAPAFKVVASDYKEFTFAEQLGFLSQLRKQKADLVHFGMTQQPVLYRGKSVTTVHDLITVRFNNPSKNWLTFKLKQMVYRRVIKRVAKKSAHIITPSQWVKDDLANFSGCRPDKISVIYESADKIIEPAVPMAGLENTKFLMYVGRPTPHKNLDKLVEAFASLSKKYDGLQLVLAGKTDKNYEKLAKKVAKTNLEKSVIFTGFVSEGQLRWLYENCQAYVFPSLSEGFGLPGLEAMVHGAPVITSNATCLPEVYGNGALYFNPHDPDDIAAKISSVLDDKNQRQELIKKGSIQAAKYSWQATASQTLKLYQEVLNV